MSINTIAATSSLNYWQQQAQEVRPDYNVHAKKSAFEELLASLTALKATDSDVEKGISAVTLTKLLSDGSLLIQRVEGSKVISETKLEGGNVLQQPHLMGLNGLATAYAGTAATGTVGTDSAFSASV
ncbi:hypothetical protein [Selenomonas ruminantium]|uniref:Uncharacterized protein n=1 Tax=Selenomonas ruminantium TaxID=971 RepID=A0A1H0RHG0_SELRU|nr:hypothetical protein [Selenomonas ruminantium]SDP28466.1 hypothetical protein SAMN05216366_1127 [Selenomonas ruminantium]